LTLSDVAINHTFVYILSLDSHRSQLISEVQGQNPCSGMEPLFRGSRGKGRWNWQLFRGCTSMGV